MLCRCISNCHECDTGIQNRPSGLGVLPTVRRLRSWPCSVFNKEVCDKEVWLTKVAIPPGDFCHYLVYNTIVYDNKVYTMDN